MFRKTMIWMAAACLWMGGAGMGQAMSSKSKGLTMLVVPARYSVMQVSFDLLRKRDAVLVSYQGDANTRDPLLHAWNGAEWIHVSLDSYRNASFLQITPHQTVLIGDESLVPRTLIEASSWCPLVMSVPSIDTATLVNSFGSIFKFRSGDWSWFAKRYNLDLNDLNEGRRKSSWYDRPGPQPKPTKSYGTEFPAAANETGSVGYPDTVMMPPPAEPEEGVVDSPTFNAVKETSGRTVTPQIRVLGDDVPAAEVILE